MAHMIETMAYVGETPWHRLGTKIDGAATMREALAAAGLDWHVELKPLYVGSDDGPDMKGEKSWMRGVIRSTDGKLLGCVGNDWTPVQPAEAFAWFDPFIQSGEARIETAGSLFGGPTTIRSRATSRSTSVSSSVPGCSPRSTARSTSSSSGASAFIVDDPNP
jgi:hypothetical protein